MFRNKAARFFRLALAVSSGMIASNAYSAPVLYIHDSVGQLGTVDVATGTANVIGSMGTVMTDIAFDPLGNLYGLSFTHLYSINKNTAAVSVIGAHGISGGNALVFGNDGTLYGAGNTTTNLYKVNLATGASASLGNIGAYSAGDLAFNGGNFYLASTNSQLVRVNLASNAAGTVVGNFGFSNVFGLATAENGVLYGVSGTSIFSVNTATGAGTPLTNYLGQGLGISYGSSFVAEAAPIPLPAAVWLFGTGLLGLIGVARRKAYTAGQRIDA
jgi:hypothetical protein